MREYVGRFFGDSAPGRAARKATLRVSRQMHIPGAYRTEMTALARAAGVSESNLRISDRNPT